MLFGVMYFAIGRDLVALAVAKREAVAMEVRRDGQRLAKDVERIVEAGRPGAASEFSSPVAFTSAAAMASTGDPSDIDAWLCEGSVETYSRAQ